MTDKKKVLIVDPSVIITEGLKKILGEYAQLEMLSPLHDMEGLKGRLVMGRPDIMIVNPMLLPKAKRHEFNNIIQDYPDMLIIALVYQYIDQNSLRMYHAIIDICEERGHIYDIVMDSLVQQKQNEQQPDENGYELTKRELDVLVQIAKGLMNKEIADKLNISIHTVISHRKNITRKTNIKSVAGLAMYALMNNLIEES
jgi:Response regulator containing a CheY-like receiver domain and an HTH DNA-binding domain